MIKREEKAVVQEDKSWTDESVRTSMDEKRIQLRGGAPFEEIPCIPEDSRGELLPAVVS
jgi:hypothetical protein